MADLAVDIAENIMKYCIIPYAEQQNISTDTLIQMLSDHHKNQASEKQKTVSKRGRPKGSKNKDKHEIKTIRKRGRPAGSNKKSSTPLEFDD